jgi:uncharacterized protein
MRVVSFIIAVVFGAPCPLGAQQAVPTSAPSPPAVPPGFEVPKDMSTYYLALYVKGPKYSIDQTPARMELTKAHLRYIRRMIEEKKYAFAGPLLDGGDRQGIAIVSAASAQEAKRLTEADPAIAAGHMAVELHPAMLPSMASLVVKY